MSNPHTHPSPARHSGRRSFLIRSGITGVVLGGLAALAVVLWPDSEADKARADGERFGAAVAELSNAEGTAEVDAAQAEIRAAAESTRTHAGEAVATQISDQADALDRAINGYLGMLTTDSDWDYELYEYELDVALDDLYDNAADLREEGPEVQQAFWEGFEDGNAA